MESVRVINLARHAARRAAFQHRNPHVPASFLDAVDGAALTMEQIRASGLFTPEVLDWYEAYSFGCTLSHRALWKEAEGGSGPLTIAEDDAVFRHDFAARSAQVLAMLPGGWDMVMWGWNFDSVVSLQAVGSVSPVVMLFDQKELREHLNDFQSLATPVQPFRVLRAFGLLAYTLSPAGAERLLASCFPQRPLSVRIPVANTYVRNVNVDVSVNAAFGHMQCYACFPPLAVSPNLRAS